MRNVKSKLLVILWTLLAVWMGYMAAYTINVWPSDYYWTLTLNKLYIMNWNSNTWIVIDWSWYEISIASGHYNWAWEWLWKLYVYRICNQGGWNCKKVSQLSTRTPIINWTGNDWLVRRTNGLSGKVRKTDNTGTPGWHDDDTGSINVTASTPTLSTWGETYDIITINGSTAKITMPSNPHIAWNIVAASSSGDTSNSSTKTSNDSTYLNYVEGTSVKGYIKIKWSGTTSVDALNGTITITSTGWGNEWSKWTNGTTGFIKPKANKAITIGDITHYINIKGMEAVSKWYGNVDAVNLVMWSRSLRIWSYLGGFMDFVEYSDGNTTWQNNSIWINKTGATATLDINWTIRIGSNCAEKCKAETKWTIVFHNNNFYWCVYNGSYYTWIVLGGQETGTVSNNIGTLPHDDQVACSAVNNWTQHEEYSGPLRN